MVKKHIATLYDGIEAYKQNHKNSSEIISAINRYLLPSFGLKLSTSRMSKAEKTKAISISKNIDLTDCTKNQLSSKLNKVLDNYNLPNSKAKVYRSRVNKFINFLADNKILKPDTLLEKPQKPHEFQSCQKLIDKTNIKIAKRRKAKPKIILSFDPEYYLNNDSNINKNFVIDELNRIRREYEAFIDFLKNTRNNRQPTVDNKSDQILRFLGWLYTQKKDLSKVKFTNIIKVINSNLSFSDYKTIDEYFIAEGRAKEETKKSTKQTINWVKKFFIDYKVDNPNTQKSYIESLISLVKFLYQDITNEDEAKDFDDIYLVRQLHLFVAKLPKKPKEIKSLYFTWNEIIEVRNSLEKEANLDCSYSYKRKSGHNFKDKKERIYINKETRTKTAIANSMMKFLIICFLTILPPDRIRTIRELKIGKTLKHGLLTENGFIDFKDLSICQESRYYIHLESKDYKTGDIYGEFWGLLPNPQFENGTTFYDYLNKWLYFGWREELLNLNSEKHDYVFLGSRKGKPLTRTGASHIVKNIFLGKTGIQLNPHRFRHIFCSYIDDIGVTAQERTSIARWMHHSEDIAKGVYTIKSLEQELAPGFKFMKKISELSYKNDKT